MNGKDMLESMSFVDEKYVEDAANIPARRKIRWQPFAAAACLALVLGAWRLTLPKAAESAAQAVNEPEIAAYSADAGDTEDAASSVMGGMLKSAAAPQSMKVRIVAQDGLTLTCTVEDPGTGNCQPGQTVTVQLPEEEEILPEQIQIFYFDENEDGTISALRWEKAE